MEEMGWDGMGWDGRGWVPALASHCAQCSDSSAPSAATTRKKGEREWADAVRENDREVHMTTVALVPHQKPPVSQLQFFDQLPDDRTVFCLHPHRLIASLRCCKLCERKLENRKKMNGRSSI